MCWWMNGPVTHVIQAPLFASNAISQAGSSDWKYSSGWKKVRIVSAFRMRNAIRNRKTSWEVATSFARRSSKCLFVVLCSSWTWDASVSNAVDACDSAGEAITCPMCSKGCRQKTALARQRAIKCRQFRVSSRSHVTRKNQSRDRLWGLL